MTVDRGDGGDRRLRSRVHNALVARLLGRDTRFDYWQRHGYHVLPVGFYSPVPDTRSLPDELWVKPHELVGVDLLVDDQLERLAAHHARFADELGALARTSPADPLGLALDNSTYSGGDPELLYCTIRDLRPKRIVEVGSGMSSLVIDRALALNEAEGAPPCSYLVIDPFPAPLLGRVRRHHVRVEPVQDVGPDPFTMLGAGDVLFVDSTHVVAPGSDVIHLVLDVLPRLAVGVNVHFHDIHLPYEHGRDWIVDRHLIWCEQHLLAAFLAFNDSFEVRWTAHLLYRHQREEFLRAFPGAANGGGAPSSFWIRRVA